MRVIGWKAEWPTLLANLPGSFGWICLPHVSRILTTLVRRWRTRGCAFQLPSVVGATEHRLLKLELVGQDRPGIVREISQVLARSGINVEELHTGVESAPMSGEKLFCAKARLAVPLELSTERLRKILEPIGNELMVDIALLPSK
jgi:predicted amino acid-binding ACT domain protein